ncbi:MAG: hypothetical protein ACRDYE_16090 [Acidimicrobiales bacterium]
MPILDHGRTGPIRGLFRAFLFLGVAAGVLGPAAAASAVFVFHLGVRPVLTGSMAPTFGPGSILVTRAIPVQDLRTGMIPLFVPPGQHVDFAHRITSVTGPATSPIITTKGDANREHDPWHARLEAATVPIVVATQPWVGRLIVGLRGPVHVALVVLGGLVVAVSGSRWLLRPPRPLGTT